MILYVQQSCFEVFTLIALPIFAWPTDVPFSFYILQEFKLRIKSINYLEEHVKPLHNRINT